MFGSRPVTAADPPKAASKSPSAVAQLLVRARSYWGASHWWPLVAARDVGIRHRVRRSRHHASR
eukprot:379661-Prymnesium_polylepis.2